MPAAELDQIIPRLSIEKHTPNTVTDRKRLKKVIEQSRLDGYSLVDQELESGLIGLAVPITAVHSVSAAIGISVHAARVPAGDVLPRYLAVLKQSAERIAAGMQWPDRAFGPG